MNAASLFFLIFLAGGSAAPSTERPETFNGIGYHFRDENSPDRIHSNLTQCEYMYDDAYESKTFLMVFPSEKEIVKKKIGFYCEGEYSECCGLKCCIPKAVIIERNNERERNEDLFRHALIFFLCLALFLIYFAQRSNREQAYRFLQRIRDRVTGIFSRKSHGDTISTTDTVTTTID